jgi:hypothetical protein
MRVQTCRPHHLLALVIQDRLPLVVNKRHRAMAGASGASARTFEAAGAGEPI